MNILEAIRRRATAVWLTVGMLIVLGVVSGWTMPSGIYPEVEFPRIVVVARSGGAPPDVFQTIVTRPLEQSLGTVEGVQTIRSRTIRGAAEIALQFAPGTDMWHALQLAASRVADAQAGLPPDTDVRVERVTTGSFPVVTFNLSGAVDPRELRELADYVVRPALISVPGIGQVDVLGGRVREIEVILDPEQTAALHLTPTDVAERIRTATGLSAVGRTNRDGQWLTVLADAQPAGVREIADIPIAAGEGGAQIALGAIAEVAEGHEDVDADVFGPRGSTVSISVSRLPAASTPDVVEKAIAVSGALKLPAGVTLTPVYDQARLVRDSIASVRDAIVLGVLLCAAVIAFFLRDLRAGALAAVAIPVTLAMTFVPMWAAGLSLNLMSLGGMAVAVGLVVDDAIVVVEAIARHRTAGVDAWSAARAGTLELAPAIMGTTLTTVVVFIPLGFLEGIVGSFFRPLAFTLTAAVLISMVVALGVIPLVAGIERFAPRVAARAERTSRYDGLVRSLVKHPVGALSVVVVLLASGVIAAPHVGQGFLPEMDEGAFVLDYFLPSGTSLEVTSGYARQIGKELAATPEVITYTARAGAELGPAAATQVNRGDIMVRLTPQSERKRSAEEIISDIRARIRTNVPEVRIEFVQVLQDVLADLAGNPRPIEIKVFGPDYGQLYSIADSISPRVNEVPGVVDLYDGHERDTPDLHFTMRRDALASLGLTPEGLTAQMDAALLGSVVGAVRREDRLVAIRTRYPDPIRRDPARVVELPLVVGDAVTTYGAVANHAVTTSPSMLVGEALQPKVEITADHEDRDLGAIAGDIDKIVRSVDVPPGYRIAVGGAVESQRDTIRQLLWIGLVAVLLVLTVLATQFRRLRIAALVLVSVPVAVVGALLGLLVTGTPLNASSLMGLVLLTGLVVKNGVLLLEDAERRLDEGVQPVEAVVLAAERRVRPVLMTTIATMAGLLPLAFGVGAGAELQRPLSIAVIGGLLTSTIATLVVMPSLCAAVLRAPKRELAGR